MEKNLSFQKWIVMITLPFLIMLSSYATFGLSGLLPLIQENFDSSDSESALLKTFGATAHVAAFSSMWIIGDLLPKKTALLVAVTMWFLLTFASTLAAADQFWLYVILRALASMCAEIFRILVNVIQAENFSGKHLTGALTLNIIGESIAALLAPIVSSLFVENDLPWQLGVVIGPSLTIPFLILASIFLRQKTLVPVSKKTSIIRNAFGVLTIPSYLLVVISQAITLFYSMTLTFWMASITLYSTQAHPDVFLGLSYSTVSTIMAFATFAGMFIGGFAVPYLTQSLQSRTALAIPAVYAVASALETMSYITEMTMISRNFPIFAVTYLVDGIASSGILLNNLQIILTTTPASQRASALSLLRLTTNIGLMPAAQIMAAISDFFRGDSIEPADRLAALQNTFLYTWFMPLISTAMCLAILRFYKKDAIRAKEIDQRMEEETVVLGTFSRAKSANPSLSAMEKLSLRQWIVMITLPFFIMLTSYANFSLSGLLPLIRENFGTSDSETALLKTFGAVAHVTAFTTMWFLGDLLPKKTALLVALTMWILLDFASILASADQFWLYLTLRALASMCAEIFRIIVNVIQAENFTGKYLTGALTMNIVGESMAVLLAPIVSSLFVENSLPWQIGVVVAPTLTIPFLISTSIFLHQQTRVHDSKPTSILRNALGVLCIPSYLLLIISQAVTMFYSMTLSFWMASIILYSSEAYPDVFLGLSYPAVSTLIAVITFAGMFVGGFGVPYLTQSLQSTTTLAIPIVYAASSALETLSYITQVSMVTRNFPIFAATYLIDGIAGSGIMLNNLQIVLTTTPASQRASALSLLRLTTSLGLMPAAQIMAAISDYFRGDSTDPADRLGALQKTFLYTWFMPLISTVMCLVIIRFYRKDVEKAKEIDERAEEETSRLISEKQMYD